MSCGGCGGPRSETEVDVDPVTGKRIASLTMRERLEYAHRAQAREIMASQESLETKRQKLQILDDWLERNLQSSAFSV